MKLFLKILKIKLRILAKLTIWRFKPKVVAITGSAGKTSTKEAVYAALREHYRVRKSSGNFNNEIGMPLAILGDWSDKDLEIISLDHKSGVDKIKKILFWIKAILGSIFRLVFLKKEKYPDILILEYGAEHPGDIRYLLEIAKPFVGVITTVGDIPPHVEFFSGPEALIKEKAKLVEYLPIANFAVLNADNEAVLAMRERTRAGAITFGFNNKADLQITFFENRLGGEFGKTEPIGISFKLKYGGSTVPVFINGAFGRGQACAVAAAVCVGLIFDLNLIEAAEGITSNYSPVKGRLNLVKGVKNSLILDDTYNASPISTAEALDILDDLPGKRKIAVLGDMLELGKYAIEAHERIGKKAGKIADILITIGGRAKFIAESAEKSGLSAKKIFVFGTPEEAAKRVQEIIKEGDLALVKASRSMHLEKIVDEIKYIG